MTLNEFSAWLDGYSAAIGDAPTLEQWQTIRTKLAQIALLTAEIANRDKLRQEDREAAREMREDVKGLRSDFNDFMSRGAK